MPRHRFDKNYLLRNAEVEAILNCYLIKGLKKGLYFSDILDMIFESGYYLQTKKRIKEQLMETHQDLNDNQKQEEINKYKLKLRDMLKNRLQQMVREDLLIQKPDNKHITKKTSKKDRKNILQKKKHLQQMKKEGLLKQQTAGQPYFLNDYWCYQPIRTLNQNFINKTPMNRITFYNPTPNEHDFGYHDENEKDSQYIDFMRGTVLYGINIDKLPERERQKILEQMEIAHDALGKIHDITNSLGHRWCIEIIEKNLGKMEYLEQENRIAIYSFLMETASDAVTVFNGNQPSKKFVDALVEVYLKLYHKKKTPAHNILVDTAYEMTKQLVKLYPFEGKWLSSFGVFQPRLKIKSDLKKSKEDDVRKTQQFQLINARMLLNEVQKRGGS